MAHIAVLAQIESPFARAALSQKPAESALRDALAVVTEEQVAEFAFIMGHPGEQSKALLARGRGELTRAAMSFALQQVSAEVLRQLAANGAPLIVAAAMRSLAKKD